MCVAEVEIAVAAADAAQDVDPAVVLEVVVQPHDEPGVQPPHGLEVPFDSAVVKGAVRRSLDILQYSAYNTNWLYLASIHLRKIYGKNMAEITARP